MKRNLMKMMLAVAAFGLVSCAQDEPEVNNKPATPTTGYLAISLASADTSSRAYDEAGDEQGDDSNWFNPGNEDEQAISSNANAHRIYFFDKSGKLTQSANLEAVGGKTYVVRVTEDVETTPDVYTSALLVVNCDPATLKNFAPATLNAALQSAELEDYFYEGNKTFFTMTSSVWCEPDSQTLKFQEFEGSLADHIKPTAEEATAAGNVVTFYVERVAAKVTLAFDEKTFGDDDLIITPKVNSAAAEEAVAAAAAEVATLKVLTWDEESEMFVSEATPWSVRIVNWGINAVEPKSYIIKNLSPVAYTAQYSVPSFYEGWKPSVAGMHRSYWAVDSNYDKDNYPDQYREADDSDDTKAYDGNESDYATLKYYSFNQIAALDRVEYRYTNENTYAPAAGSTVLDNMGYLRAYSHIVIAAQLLFGEDEKALEVVPSKYYDGTGYMSEKTMIQKMFFTLNNYLVDNDIELTVDGEAVTMDNCDNYFTLEAANIKGGDGWAKFAVAEGVTFDNANFNFGEAVEAAEVVAVKAFTNGYMYYAIPILHEKTFETFNADAIAVGDLGVVRNHWYRAAVSAITKVGTPVEDPDQPIIPNEEPSYLFLGVQIEILPWRVVDMGGTIL